MPIKSKNLCHFDNLRLHRYLKKACAYIFYCPNGKSIFVHFTTFEYFLKTTSVDGLIQIHSFFNVRIKNSRTYELLVTKKSPEACLLFGYKSCKLT